MFRRALLPVSALALAGLIAGASPAAAAVKAFTFQLSPSQEVTGGEAGDTGFARVVVDTQSGTICYVVSATTVTPAVAAHIHEAPPGVSGPVVLPLEPPVAGRTAGCVYDPQLARAIARHPHRYYVNVHTVAFPGGALRGQLA